MMENIEEIYALRKQAYENEGQGHVFNAWDQLNEEEKVSLIEQTDQYDVDHLNDLFDDLVVNSINQI